MIKSALGELQCGFQDYILGHDDRALSRVESTQTLSAERRLNIYHNAYRARLVELLADTYERVLLYIGDDTFDTAARAYIEAHPPTARMLRDYGAGFPAFLAEAYPGDLEVAELAEMDLRLRNAFDAVDAAVLQVADLAGVAPEAWDSVVFCLHPTVTFQRFGWNTPEIWQHLADGAAPPPASALAQPVTWTFWRKELQPHYRSLSDAEYFALHAISEGITFGELCAQLSMRDPALDVSPRVATWLRSWLDDGILQRTSVL